MNRQTQELYRRHRTAVYHLALSYLKSPAAAEDVMQDVFVALMEADGVIRHPAAWLMTATRNRCLNRLRDGEREIPWESLPEGAGPPEREDALFVEQMLALLTEEERRTFALHHLDGYRYREIAEGLDVPLGTVQTRCRTARKKLRMALEKEEKRFTAVGKEKRV